MTVAATDPAAAQLWLPQWVHGVNPDAVALAVQACPAVTGLHGGPFGEVTTYLPGRRVTGVAIGVDTITIGVVARWGVPIRELRAQIAAASMPLLAGHQVNVFVGDIDVPTTPTSADAPTPSGRSSAAELSDNAPTSPFLTSSSPPPPSAPSRSLL